MDENPKIEGLRSLARAKDEQRDMASPNEKSKDLESVSMRQRVEALEAVGMRQRKHDDEHGLLHDFPDRHLTQPSWSWFGRLESAFAAVDAAKSPKALRVALVEISAISVCWFEAIRRREVDKIVGRIKRRSWWRRLFRR